MVIKAAERSAAFSFLRRPTFADRPPTLNQGLYVQLRDRFMNGVITNLRSLGVFKGRESPGRFWPYVACVIALTMVGAFAVMIPVMNDFFAKAARLAAEHPEAVSVQTSPGGYSVRVAAGHPEVMPDFGLMFGGIGATVALAAALLAAAVARRLHDSGLTGWLGLLPLPFLAFGLVAMPRVFAEVAAGSETPDLTPVLLLFLNNMLYLAALGILVLLLCRRGTPGPNRFGEPADA
ncbi:DUF805 domain-containing protein [Caulobacter sp. 17J80-11]|uniref:DUF805 domain-containing protein n=1 Tax=Caulobacter sp. 17J80-11 TaxID=2763502 RepID=UPI001653D298|nr:DUF805 domain-containing protein [Caulobacter sp. 17J80-11]MBC6980704.1 DUF805 domain-containing protein [Caulobacter sp. 17J80-11]